MIDPSSRQVAEPPILIGKDGHITLVTLNRPSKANALTLAMMADLWRTWEEFDRDDDQHVLVLTGAGKRFCAGRDLGELATSRQDDMQMLADLRPPGAPENWFFRLLPDVTKPTIAAVNGAAVGGGWGLVQRCDFRIAADTAFFQINEIAHGLGAGNFLVELAREIPPVLVTEMVQLGEPMSAQRAYEVGLVNRVVPQAELALTATTMAQELSRLSIPALRANKEAIIRSRYPDHDILWKYAQHAFDKLRRR